MEPKPCPYRKLHEWEWEQPIQGWRCRHCYATTTNRAAPVVEKVAEGVTESDIPTPPFPFPAVNGLVVGPKALLECSVASCNRLGRMTHISGNRYASRCSKHRPNQDSGPWGI